MSATTTTTTVISRSSDAWDPAWDVESVYDEVDVTEMDFDEDELTFYYPCPCGDRFQITVDQIMDGDDVAVCPSCSLRLKVRYDPEDFVEEEEEDDEEAG